MFLFCNLSQASFAGKSETNVLQNKFSKLTDNNAKYKEGQILVKYKDNQNLEGIKGKVKNKVKKNLAKSSSFTPEGRMISENVELINVDPKEDINALTNELNKDSDLEYAQPNYIYSFDTIPTDPRFSEQWALRNTATNVDINATKAWDITTGQSSVIVGIMDNGIDVNHPDLVDNIYINPGEIPGNNEDDDNNNYEDDVNGYDFYNDDSTVFDSVSVDTHATHVAGIIAARMNNNTGVAGVAPNVKILPMKIGQSSPDTAKVLSAIEYAEAMGVSIVNCSWSTYIHDRALYEAMEDSEMLFIVSASNEKTDTSKCTLSPASFELPNVMTVASVDSYGNLSDYSNYGPYVDIAAPGDYILSTYPIEDNETTYDGDEYKVLSGTSMAAPFVAGVAALVKSQNPGYTASDIVNRIKSTAVTDTAISKQVPGGLLVDAYQAVKSGPAFSFNTPLITENSIDLFWNPVPGATTYQTIVNNSIPFYSPLLFAGLNSLQPDTCYSILLTAKNSLNQTITEKRIIVKTLALGTGTGLKADYYNDSGLNTQVLTRDENINFNWGTGSPDSSINTTNFSAVWQGQLEAEYSEAYTFSLNARGAARLWINGTKVAETTTDTTDVEQQATGTITLESGKLYPIQVEYYESFSNASIQLSWSSASQDEEIIPARRLYPNIGINGTWTQGNQAASLSVYNMTKVVSANGKYYAVVSGLSEEESGIRLYDESQDAFVSVSGFPVDFLTAWDCASLGNKIYFLYGGPGGLSNCIASYDVVTGVWDDLACTLPYDANTMNSLLTINGELYLFGTNTNNEVKVYDFNQNEFVYVADMPDLRRYYSLVEYNGNVYMSGGYDQDNNILKSVQIFNPQTGNWTQGSDMPIPRQFHNSVVFGNKLYFMGGLTNPFMMTDRVDIYDPSSNNWFTGDALPTQRAYAGAAVIKGKIFTVYGVSAPYTSYNYFDSFTPQYAATYKISGYVNPDLSSSDPNIKAGFKVEICDSWQYATTNADGYFEITGVPINTSGYSLKISKEQYLYRPIANAKVKAADLSVGSQTTPVDMWAGDVNKDNAINSSDYMAIANNVYPKTYMPIYDLNKDDEVNITDINIVITHVSATPSSYPSIF